MMQVLLCLAQRSGEVVSKEQLVREVWRDTFVTDDVLIRCVSELRKAFGDSAAKPAFIETIPKKGYRLLVPVTPVPFPDRLPDNPGHELADSIAILPFENTGHYPDLEYLSDGITETIINNLSQLERLRVVPRTTVFRYKGKASDPIKAGRALGTRVVVTGHLVQRGDKLIIGVELIDAAQESLIWGGKYDCRPEDVLAVQHEIVGEISSRLQLRLGEKEKGRLSRPATESREAYHLFLKAVHFANKWTAEGLRKGFDYTRQAIDADPTYAAAYTSLAYLYLLIAFFGDAPPSETFPKAKAAALKALRSHQVRQEAKCNDDDLRCKSFLLELIVAHLWDQGWNGEPLAVDDYPRAFEQVLGYIVRTGLRTPVIFTDFYVKTGVASDGKPIQVWDPVNPANNVARTYTESDRQRLVKTATTALEEITWAVVAPTKGDANDAWRTVLGPGFEGA